MIIDIIIPTLNSEKTLKNCLKSIQKLKKNSTFNVKTIIIDGGSSDNTLKIAKTFGAIIYYNLRSPHTIGSSRNLGVKKATGDYLAFIDSDEIFNKNWLNETFQMISQGYKLITGQIIPRITNNYGKIYFNLRNLIPQKKKEHKIFVPRPIRCCEIKVAKQIQFDPNLHIGEDLDFAYRVLNAGNTLIYNPNIIIYHNIPDKFGKILLKEKSYGIGVLNLFYKHRNYIFLKYCIINLLYTISPIYYHRIFSRPLKLTKKDVLLLIIFGLIKSLMNCLGYLYFILNHKFAFRKKQ